MRTTEGPRRVDVIYRRVDDAYLDPLAFRADSMLGVPACCRSIARAAWCWLTRLAPAWRTKSIYPYVPEMIRFYLGEQPILNNIPTWQCRKPEDLRYVLSNLEDGGQGGPWRRGIRHAGGPAFNQRGAGGFASVCWPIRPTISRTPWRCRPAHLRGRGLSPRHIDLRPCALRQEMRLVPGGLTRVALTEGSLVVNSSQGGGTKDTWVMEDDESC
jgi:uncharacterized circularly permuted ATP-grasp superfamily protein